MELLPTYKNDYLGTGSINVFEYQETPLIDELNKSDYSIENLFLGYNLSGTAYDVLEKELIAKNNCLGGDKLMINNSYRKLEKYYNRFISMFLILSILFLITLFVRISFLPKEISIAGTIVFIIGAFGMYTDKICWEDK